MVNGVFTANSRSSSMALADVRQHGAGMLQTQVDGSDPGS
jgi:hypothetical protein